jgi:ferredoxin
VLSISRRATTKYMCPGACGGSCACSTCHIIVQDEDYFDKMPEAEDDENGMQQRLTQLLPTDCLQTCWTSPLA